MSVAAHISFWNSTIRPDRDLKKVCLRLTMANLLTIPDIDIFVHTNEDRDLDDVKKAATVVVHEIRLGEESPLLLTHRSRDLIKELRNKYDYVIYTEDDIGINVVNMSYYTKYERAAFSAGYYLDLLTVGHNLKLGKFCLTEPCRLKDRSVFTTIDIGGVNYLTSFFNTYNPFFILPKYELNRWIDNFPDMFMLKSGIPYKGLITENAAMGPKPVGTTSSCMYKRVVYVDAPGLLVYHFPSCVENNPSEARYGGTPVDDLLDHTTLFTTWYRPSDWDNRLIPTCSAPCIP